MKKVALVCDWLTEKGGAEDVLMEFHKIFPDAPIYTSQYRKRRIDWFKDAEVKTGWLNYFPVFSRRFIAPLRQQYFKNLDLSDYDLVVSVTGCDAKSIRYHYLSCGRLIMRPPRTQTSTLQSVNSPKVRLKSITRGKQRSLTRR